MCWPLMTDQLHTVRTIMFHIHEYNTPALTVQITVQLIDVLVLIIFYLSAGQFKRRFKSNLQILVVDCGFIINKNILMTRRYFDVMKFYLPPLIS